MNNTKQKPLAVYKPNLDKLLRVAMKPIEIRTEIIENEDLKNNYGGNIGDYIVVLPTGNCFVLNKKTFETMFQAIPSKLIN